MNPTRKTKQADLEATQQYNLEREKLRPTELIDEKLTQLQVFIRHMGHTPAGRAEIDRRIQRFGVCQRGTGESSQQFYGKLRQWLDRDLEQPE